MVYVSILYCAHKMFTFPLTVCYVICKCLYLSVNMFKISSINHDPYAHVQKLSVQCTALENLGGIDNWLCMIAYKV